MKVTTVHTYLHITHIGSDAEWKEECLPENKNIKLECLFYFNMPTTNEWITFKHTLNCRVDSTHIWLNISEWNPCVVDGMN